MHLLLDEMVPIDFTELLSDLGHQPQHVVSLGLQGKSDRDIFAFARPLRLIVLTFNKYKNEPDRRDALTAMSRGQRIVCVTARGLLRQQEAIERKIGLVETYMRVLPVTRRATIMNDYRVRFESASDIRDSVSGRG